MLTRVRHWKFGVGTVLDSPEAGRVRVQFNDCAIKLLDVALARLEILQDRPAPASAPQALAVAKPRVQRSAVQHAARIAGYLRRVAIMLRERGPDATPLPVDWHLWLLGRIGNYHEFTREVADPGFAWGALTAGCADRVEQLAMRLESEHGLPPGPPRWLPRPAGQWKGVIHNLVMQVDVSADWLRSQADALGQVVWLDPLKLAVEPAVAPGNRSLPMLTRAQTLLRRAERRLGEHLREARIGILPANGGPGRYRVVMQTLERGLGVEVLLERRGPQKYVWVDIADE